MQDDGSKLGPGYNKPNLHLVRNASTGNMVMSAELDNELSYEEERQIAQKNNSYLPKKKLNRWMIMGVLLMEFSAAAGLLYLVYRIYTSS